MEDSGVEVRTYVGPINEGADLHIRCESLGGQPSPDVVWLLNDQIIDDVIEDVDGEITRNELTIRGVTRSMLRSEVTCQASNNKVSPALTATATIDMNLRPLDVSIHHPREPLSSGRIYDIPCSSRGSRPPAVLTWWRGSTRLPATSDTTTHDGNVSTSVVRLQPNSSDDGELLACRAENRNIPTAVIEDSWILSVYYAPTARAALGSSLNPNNIREGDDVYFECEVQANPRAYKVVWKHNGALVRQEKENGILLTNRSLVVQEVTRKHAGQYTCQASNVEGDAMSPPVTLSVQFSPVCRPGQVSVYGVSKLEDAQVACQVDAVPQVTRFYWTFNNTAETLEVPESRFTVGLGGRSVVIYTPMSDLDYGTLLCTAENMVGRQTQPCVFHIIPATQPEAPTNCTIVNVSASSLTVVCSPGFDGGLNQTYAMEVYGSNPHTLKANVSSKIPRFVVSGLDNDSEFQLIVYSGNAKGRSSITRLVALTQKLPVKQLETRLGSGKGASSVSQDEEGIEVTPLLGVLAGIVFVLAIIAAVVIAILKVQSNNLARRQRSQQQQQQHESKKKSKKQTSKDNEKQQQQQKHHTQKHPSAEATPASRGLGDEGRKSSDDNHPQRYNDVHHIHLLRQDDQSPDVVACSGDCDEVSVSIRSGGLLSGTAGHHSKSQHLQQCHQHSPSLSQHSPQCHQQKQHLLQQHYQQPQLLSQHSQDPHHYTMSLPDHTHLHNPRHAHLHRHGQYTATQRSCSNADIEVHFSEGMADCSSTPPTPAPDDVTVALMYMGDSSGKPIEGNTPGMNAGGLARIPEDPESPTSARRESAV
ncbi:nephrin-like isoform X2 [Macrobrachium nipponense]